MLSIFRRSGIAGAALLLALGATVPVRAQTVTSLVVHVRDEAGAPISGARVTIEGTGQARTAVTGVTGDAAIATQPDTYRVTVAADGRVTASTSEVTLTSGGTTTVSVTLTATGTDATTEIGRTRTAADRLNTTVSAAGSVVTPVSVGIRQNPELKNYAYNLPGLTTFQSAKSSTVHFKIRGADNEPRTQLDGHVLTNTGAGNFLVGWLNADAFDRIDVEKGPGIARGDEGRTTFGTIDLVTHRFSDTPQFDSTFGVNDQNGSRSQLSWRGALGAGKRLHYVLGYGFDGQADPANGYTGLFLGPARTGTNANASSAVAAYASPLAGGLGLRYELAKVEYAFSPVTRLSLGYVGFHGVAAPLGGKYAGYEGMFTVAPCFVNGAPGTPAQCATATTVTAPALAPFIGSTQPLYSGYTAGSERNNEPFFEATLSTTLGKELISISPFRGVVNDILLYTAPAAAIAGLPSSRSATDRESGFTAKIVHPLANGYVQFAYNYHSDATTVYTGAPFTPATLTTPTTMLRENDFSLTSQLRLRPKLSLGLGLFLETSRYDGVVQAPGAIAGGAATTAVPFLPNVLSFSHLDPHVGLVYQPDAETTLRASAGSAVYGPGSSLVSGRASFTPPAASNSGLGLITNVNPGLRHETTVAYELGADRRLRDGAVLSLSLYHNAIHDKFLTYTYQGGPVITPSGILTPLVSQTVNAALQRDFGVELALRRQRTEGIGYDLDVSLNRTYFSQLPAGYFTFATAPLSPFAGYQGTTNPYSTIHGELRYAHRGVLTALGFDAVGADNVTRAAGYATVYASVRAPVTPGVAMQLTVENLLNQQSAAGIAGTGPLGSGSSTITALPGPTGALVYSQTLVPVLQIPPRVIRFSLIQHFGR
jgi:hypothetical protein